MKGTCGRYALEAGCELDFTDSEAMSEMQTSVHVRVREAGVNDTYVSLSFLAKSWAEVASRSKEFGVFLS